MFAAFNGSVSVVKALLAAGAGLEFSGNWYRTGTTGLTALLWGIYMKHHNVVQILLAAGADASAQTSIGDNALGLAVHYADAKMVKMIADNLSAGKKSKRGAEGAAAAEGKKKKKKKKSIKKENKENVFCASIQTEGCYCLFLKPAKKSWMFLIPMMSLELV